MSLLLLWVGCSSAPRDPQEGVLVEQALAIDERHALIDRAVTQIGPAGRDVRRDRCRVDGAAVVGCLPAIPERSYFRRVGAWLLDERVREIGPGPEDPGERFLAVLDPATGGDRVVVGLGAETPGEIGGGSIRAMHDGGLLIAATHDLLGVRTFDAEARVVGTGSYALEAWSDQLHSWPMVGPRWRVGLPRWPDDLFVTPTVVGAHAADRWFLVDAAEGVVLSESAGAAGACVIDGVLHHVSEGRWVQITLASGARLERPFPTSGWVTACVPWRGAPLFHGADRPGQGWLQGPDFPRLSVDRIDPWLAAHLHEDRLYVGEGGVGLAIVDLVSRTIVQHDDAMDVIVTSDGLLWYDIVIDTNLSMTLHRDEQVWTRSRRISPRASHVAGPVLWTFAYHPADDEPVAQRLRTSDLAPVD